MKGFKRSKKYVPNFLRIGGFENHSFFDLAILKKSKFLGYQGWVEILMITLVSSRKSPTPNISASSVSLNPTYLERPSNEIWTSVPSISEEVLGLRYTYLPLHLPKDLGFIWWFRFKSQLVKMSHNSFQQHILVVKLKWIFLILALHSFYD